MRRTNRKFMVICINSDDLMHKTKIYNDFDIAMESFKARVGEIALDMIHDAEKDKYGGSRIADLISEIYDEPVYFVDKNGSKVGTLPMTAKQFEEDYDNYIEVASDFETICLETVEEEV